MKLSSRVIVNLVGLNGSPKFKDAQVRAEAGIDPAEIFSVRR